jgi:hypothetical protein
MSKTSGLGVDYVWKNVAVVYCRAARRENHGHLLFLRNEKPIEMRKVRNMQVLSFHAFTDSDLKDRFYIYVSLRIYEWSLFYEFVCVILLRCIVLVFCTILHAVK